MAILISLLVLSGITYSESPEWTYAVSPNVIRNTQGYLTLVSPDFMLDADFIPHDLVEVAAKKVNDSELRKEANDALNAMFAAALSNGLTLYVKSAYRNYQTQKTMFNNRLDSIGHNDGVLAYPGSSDHQTGLGVDVLNYAWTLKEGMTKEFGKTQEAKWLAAHCYEYGYILRYMEDKEDITGIMYEPWHFRYVGIEAATYIMSNHLSLEEFTQEWQKAIAVYEAAGGNLDEYCRLLSAPKPPITLDEAGDDGDSEVSIFYPLSKFERIGSMQHA